MLLVEAGLPPLAPPGLDVALMPVADLAGHAHAILVEEGGLCAACDPRADGVAVGE
jgi:gamma-glutamyltranspeptidase